MGNTCGAGVLSVHFANITTWGSESAVLAGKPSRVEGLFDGPKVFDVFCVAETHLTELGVNAVNIARTYRILFTLFQYLFLTKKILIYIAT